MKKIMKTWETPQLIILGRANAEENVLKGCKAIGAEYTTIPTAVAQVGCDKIEGTSCGACQNRSGKGS
jgi:hypothetical protein